ncbi:MAG TPA: transcription-repair coupling factor [Candidatus Dormibacteraeota bacterium]|nr:transcription-repair coupling factor [Candidatus Dormibacteraeota bacterium]
MADAAVTLRARLDVLPPLHHIAAGRGTENVVVAGVPAGAVGLLAWWVREATGRRVLVLTTEPERVYNDCAVWSGEDGMALFPAADTLPFDRIGPGEEVTRRRLMALSLLTQDRPALVVTSPSGLLRPTLPVSLVREGVITIRPGQTVPRDALVKRLVALGYRREVAVSSPGEFAVRGGILDVNSLDRSRPWRAEWFGDEVEELRAFDPDTQTSVAKLQQVSVIPARELDLTPDNVERALSMVGGLDISAMRDEVREIWLRDRDRLAEGVYAEGVDVFTPYLQGETAWTLLDHMGPDAIVLVAGSRESLWRAAHRHLTEAEGLREQEEDRGELPGGARTGLLSLDAARGLLSEHRVVELVREADDPVDTGEASSDTASPQAVDLGWRGVESFTGRFEALASSVAGQLQHGAAVLMLSRQEGRVEELAREQGLAPIDAADFDASTTEIPAGALIAAPADLSQGFSTGTAGVDVYSDHELFGVVKRRGSPLARGQRRAESTSARGRRAATGPRAAQRAFVIEFEPGDLVVHSDHGIGRFVEMRRVADDEGEHEYMTLEYSDGDKLYVPVAHLDRIDRYIGGSDAHPKLSKLGTGEWERTKRRVKQRTEEVARELIALYSRREASQGHPFPPDGAWQQELESSFPFQETPDQELVLDDIKRDMEVSRPMDRVVCGDVGFGKTELALRAAFKAAADGKQVALLVPTTVLAQQHYTTFSTRLRPFPITVRQLSRFCSPEEIEDTLRGLMSGSVDIVIGTHRLLQKDVQFKNLGLVIIDEEQRFGVLQKERFKQLRVAVDVLSLSATPIPRTLHMALAGIRDLSVIQTPPEERQPIKTFVTAREDSLIREVITRELARGGQVYFVHNRVQSIDREADRLRDLLPGVRIETAHGQMPEGQLAAVMQRFMDGDVDVLVCTTIIESGLDISNANTIIVNDSHRLGLAQLYQLRGRVGRAGQRAYAYILYPPERSLTEKADKRLDVIQDLQDLGAGFKLALRDLEIRGAGNLLGEEQHGEIAAVGMELYNNLLRHAVEALQGKPVVDSPAQITVSLPVAAFLPPSYVSDERLRLRCYQDLAACVNEAELDQRARGLVDRFGAMPPAAEELVYSLRVRLLAAACGALGVEQESGAVIVRLPLGHGLDLVGTAMQFRQTVTASPTRLRLDVRRGDWQDTLLKMLRELGRLERARQKEMTVTA